MSYFSIGDKILAVVRPEYNNGISAFGIIVGIQNDLATVKFESAYNFTGTYKIKGTHLLNQANTNHIELFYKI